MTFNVGNYAFGGYDWAQAAERTALIKKLKAAARELREEGEKYKVIPSPFGRRAILDKTFNAGVTIKMQVTVRATDIDGGQLDMTRVWMTKNGKNIDIHRPSQGLGEYNNFGPYIFDYSPSSNGLTKLKIQTDLETASIIFYTVKQVG